MTAHLLGFVLPLLLLSSCQTSPTAAMLYDQQAHQTPILRHSQLDSVLHGLEKVPFSQLDPAYMEAAGIEGSWKRILSRKTWYAVRGSQVHRYLVGQHRVGDFLPRGGDWEERQVHLGAEGVHYLCIDARVLHRLLDLLQGMVAQGLDVRQVWINHGFRPPRYNAAVGGAPKSRHQYGEAIDLLVGDVNHDGRLDPCDKEPMLTLLDTKIIGSQGGVGKYPHSQVIHMDVRGYRARWDFQK